MLIGLVFDLDTIITPPSNLATAPTTKKYTHQKTYQASGVLYFYFYFIYQIYVYMSIT